MTVAEEAVEAGAALPAVEVIPLGAGQEVGRSCIIVKYMGKTVMLDCGVHPGFKGPASLPFFDAVDLDQVDLMLITHFHLDHVAAAPYVATQTDFKGKILMTHPTKAITWSLLSDFVKVSRNSVDEGLYTEQDLKTTLDRTDVIDFNQTVEENGIKVTAYRAGHVLGAAMFLIQIAGMRLLYTGDYSRLPDRHLSAADLPPETIDILVVEATYGTSSHEKRNSREQRLVDKVRSIVARGGRCLMPVVALGRAQELLLILEEYWERNPDLAHVPIYQASALATRAMSIFQTYIEMMNEDIKAAFQAANPFKFKHVVQATKPDVSGPCVVMATPSMLQGGMSRDLFDMFASNPKDGLIIADFAVQGTLARSVLDSPADVLTRDGRKVPLRMSVDAISFSAHADYPQTSEFVGALKPPHVVLVHGEATNMAALRAGLLKSAASAQEAREVYMPRVTQAVRIPHKPEHLLKVVGRLAELPLVAGRQLAGLLVRRRGRDTLVALPDLPAFTELHPGRIHQRQAIPLTCPFSEVRLALELMFEGLSTDAALPAPGVTGNRVGTAASNPNSIVVAGVVTVTLVDHSHTSYHHQQPQQQQQQQQQLAGPESKPEPRSAVQSAADAEADADVKPRVSPTATSAADAPLADSKPSAAVTKPPDQTVAVQSGEAAAGGSKRSAPQAPPHMVMEWEGGAHADMIADAVTAVLLQTMEEPAEVSAAEKRRRIAHVAGDSLAKTHAEMEIVAAMLSAQFGPAQVDLEQRSVQLQVDGKDVVVDYEDSEVVCTDSPLKARIELALGRISTAMRPICLE